MHRSIYFVLLSSICLIVVLLIQLYWVVETARVKEALFNDKALRVLAKTKEAVQANSELCKNIQGASAVELGLDTRINVGFKDKAIIDSILKHFMQEYQFEIDYSFELINTSPVNRPKGEYNANVITALQLDLNREVEFKLILPQKKHYILAEMGPPFLIAITLLILMLVIFWRTFIAYNREKAIAKLTASLVSNMTHELKTPLTNIALAGNLISRELADNEGNKISRYTSIILGENEKLKQVVDRVLTMQLFESNQLPIKLKSTNVHELILKASKYFELQIEDKAGQLELHLDAEHYWLFADETHFTHAIHNLIDNAIKYSNCELHVVIRTYNEKNKFCMSIRDSGAGIATAYHDLIFDKYFRIPQGNVHDVKGYGLGLSYVNQVIKSHQGSIQVNSELGKGTTFILSIAHE